MVQSILHFQLSGDNVFMPWKRCVIFLERKGVWKVRSVGKMPGGGMGACTRDGARLTQHRPFSRSSKTGLEAVGQTAGREKS